MLESYWFSLTLSGSALLNPVWTVWEKAAKTAGLWLSIQGQEIHLMGINLTRGFLAKWCCTLSPWHGQINELGAALQLVGAWPKHTFLPALKSCTMAPSPWQLQRWGRDLLPGRLLRNNDVNPYQRMWEQCSNLMEWAISAIRKPEKLGAWCSFSLSSKWNTVCQGEVGWEAWEVGSSTQLFWLRLTSPVAALETSVRLA